jgi:hypothetical protein
MWMRDGDRGQPAEPLDPPDRRLVDQADAVPQDVAVRVQDEEGALRDGESRPYLQAEEPLRLCVQPISWSRPSAAISVQLCPPAGTYCRSSSQMGQAAGGPALSGYCVPQVTQMKRGMVQSLNMRW